MKELTKEEIEKALEQLNGNYGRGDIYKIDYYRHIAYCKLQYGTTQYGFRVAGCTVFMCQHQVTIKS
jgi:hypothetical protein